MDEKRLNNIDKFVDDFFPENKKTPEEKAKSYIDKFDNLKEFKYIRTIEDFNKLKLGCRIRYVNNKEEFRWGGLLIKKIKKKEGRYLILANSEMKYFQISYDINYIFTKKVKKRNDNLRDIFLKSAGFDLNDFPVND